MKKVGDEGAWVTLLLLLVLRPFWAGESKEATCPTHTLAFYISKNGTRLKGGLGKAAALLARLRLA